jgi:2-methylcitrate dehydratase PrpD
MVVGAALAVAEEVGATGADLITAVAVGYEVMGRIGRGLGKSYVYGRGFHPVGVLGPFGAAVTAARLRDADERTMFHSIGLAASQGSGTLEYNQTWGESTRMHAGFAAAAGIRSAELALLGVPGPGSPIEGKYGFARVHSDEVDLEAITSGLGDEWSLLVNSFKVRPYHGMVHNCVDVCIEALERAGRQIDDESVDTVDSIEIGLCAAGVRGIVEGAQPSRFDESLTALNFSLPVPVAHAILTNGAVEAVVNFAGVTEPIARLASKVSGHLDDECERAWEEGKLLASVRMRFTDGPEIVHSTYRRGSNENPVGTEGLKNKFLELAGAAVGGGEAHALLDEVMRLEELDDLGALSAGLEVAAGVG